MDYRENAKAALKSGNSEEIAAALAAAYSLDSNGEDLSAPVFPDAPDEAQAGLTDTGVLNDQPAGEPAPVPQPASTPPGTGEVNP